MNYEVDLTVNGNTFPIDSVTAREGYTAADYVRDCNMYADADWCEMLASGEVTLIEYE